MPLYLVKTPTGDHLVEAANKNAAIKHVITPGVSAEVLSALDAVKHSKVLPLQIAGDNDAEKAE